HCASLPPAAFNVVPKHEIAASPCTRCFHSSGLSKSTMWVVSFELWFSTGFLTKTTISWKLSSANNWLTKSFPVAPVAPIINAFIKLIVVILWFLQSNYYTTLIKQFTEQWKLSYLVHTSQCSI